MQSYAPFPERFDSACADMRGPAGVAGLDQTKIAVLDDRNQQLNDVLAAGAERYGFAVVAPELRPLCSAAHDGMGPDLQGLADAHPFHPTAVGALRIAAALLPAVADAQVDG